MNSKETLYIPNLNGIRFIAAFVVFIHHLEFTKLELGLPNIWNSSLGFLGDMGVTLFFTLSGFLITYLLLLEKQKTSTIDIKSFYLRRILRIWPLYYIIVILSLFVLPNIPFFDLPTTPEAQQNGWLKMLLFVLMVPNVIFSFFPRLPYGVQTWSIGVEEQFYAVWPWIIKYSSRIIVSLLLIYFAFLFVSVFKISNFLPHSFAHLLSHFRIGCMAAGGLAASLYFYKPEVAGKIMNLPVQLLALAAIFILLFWMPVLRNHEIFSVLFAILILNFAFSKKPLFNLEVEPLKYFGKISYGIYMYQLIGISIALKSYWLTSESLIISNLYFYIVAFVITIIMSSVSYEFIEKKFLKIRKGYQVVKTVN